MNVSEIMAPIEFSLGPDSTVAEAARMMLERRVRGIPVTDTNNEVIGLVTERDLVAKHANVHLPVYIGFLGAVAPFRLHNSDEELRRALAVRVVDLMETDPITIAATSSVEDAATLMVDRGVDTLPVLDAGRLVGIVSASDIIRLVLIEEEDASEGE